MTQTAQAAQTIHLSHKQTHVLGQIFQHPASHNLEWREVIALVAHLGTVEEKENGYLKFVINGVSEVFHRSPEKDVSPVQQVLDIRHFMEKAGVEKNGATTKEPIDAALPLRLLVVINQQETLIFRTEGKGAVPEHLHPHDPHGYLGHQNHTRGGDVGSRLPENTTYYENIAKTLIGADEILLMGNGSGASSTMTHLRDFLVTHHHEIANRIVGNLTVDMEAMTEGQFLQEARTFYTNRDGS